MPPKFTTKEKSAMYEWLRHIATGDDNGRPIVQDDVVHAQCAMTELSLLNGVRPPNTGSESQFALELLDYADNPASQGFVPISPSTLRRAAALIQGKEDPNAPHNRSFNPCGPGSVRAGDLPTHPDLEA